MRDLGLVPEVVEILVFATLEAGSEVYHPELILFG
jgi:hypothetical protein